MFHSKKVEHRFYLVLSADINPRFYRGNENGFSNNKAGERNASRKDNKFFKILFSHECIIMSTDWIPAYCRYFEKELLHFFNQNLWFWIQSPLQYLLSVRSIRTASASILLTSKYLALQQSKNNVYHCYLLCTADIIKIKPTQVECVDFKNVRSCQVF